MPQKWGALEVSEAGKVIDHAQRQPASCRQRTGALSSKVMVNAEFDNLESKEARWRLADARGWG